jgi:hypothetical protein
VGEWVTLAERDETDPLAALRFWQIRRDPEGMLRLVSPYGGSAQMVEEDGGVFRARCGRDWAARAPCDWPRCRCGLWAYDRGTPVLGMREAVLNPSRRAFGVANLWGRISARDGGGSGGLLRAELARPVELWLVDPHRRPPVAEADELAHVYGVPVHPVARLFEFGPLRFSACLSALDAAT